MLALDRSAFTRQLRVAAVRVAPKLCSTAMTALRSHLLGIPRITPVFDGGEGGGKLVALNPCVKIDDESTIPDECKEFIRRNNLELTTLDVTVPYERQSTAEILKQILPSGSDVPASFETIGHIAHLNLRDEHLPYKTVIGQVFLDKNPGIRTVVNKVGTIANQFRVFDMEVLAGESNLVAEVKQQGCTFRLDYSKVYWNSRLDMEHKRLVDQFFNEGDEIWDVFAGIGPFSIPAAKKGCTVHGNDLNPDSTRYLEINAKLNKVQSRVNVTTLDGREFIRKMAATGTPKSGASTTHIVMNLPAIAVEFLDAMKRAFCSRVWKTETLPMVHCYQFSKEEDPAADVANRIKSILGVDHFSPIIHEVRDVAPKKLMMCFSFRLPSEAALRHDGEESAAAAAVEEERARADSNSEGRDEKRQRTEEEQQQQQQ